MLESNYHLEIYLSIRLFSEAHLTWTFAIVSRRVVSGRMVLLKLFYNEP